MLDVVFGTFRNPEGFAAQTGYYQARAERVGEMLLGRDLSRTESALGEGAAQGAEAPAVFGRS